MKNAISNNGTVHYAVDHTVGWAAKLINRVLNWSSYKKTAHPGFVRKLCDGQWVKDKGLPSSLVVNCEACLRNGESYDEQLRQQFARLR